MIYNIILVSGVIIVIQYFYRLYCTKIFCKIERRWNQSILEETNHEYSLEGLVLKLKLQYVGHLMGRADSLEKDPDAGKE